MNDQRLKSLDEFSDESDQFEDRFLKLREVKDNDSASRQLIADIGVWLQECARHGRFIPSASADRRALRSMMERWKSRLRMHGHLLDDIDSLADFDPNAGIVLTGDCPYPGLEPYEENRCGSFFGRDALVADCVQHLEQVGNRILLLIGASGSGKSSVALAGVVPQLKKNNHGTWLFCPPLTPGANPLSALAISVADVIDHPDQTTEIEETLSVKPDKAFDVLANLCGDKPLMLLIDQFEELFTQCHDERMQSVFANVLCALSEPVSCDCNFSCKILLTLRTDQQMRFENSKALKSLHDRLIDEKNEHFRYLSTIGFNHIKHAIKKPADEVGLRFIPASLIDQLASQTAGLTNGLPLLQFSLQHLWKNRPNNEDGEPLDLITEEMVQRLPDVELALGKVADNIFQDFSVEQKKICERLLLELMVLDESFEEPLRRRRVETELRQVLASLPGNSDDIAMVINAFVDERLLRRFGDGAESYIEVAHEALLRHWDHIYNLLMEGEVKERLHLIKKIKAEALDWQSHPDNICDYLNLKGERLKLARKYAQEKWLEEEESAAYVAACSDQEAQVKEAARQALINQEKSKLQAKKLRNSLKGMAIILVCVVVFSYTYAVRKDAEVASEIADLLGEGFSNMQLNKIRFAQNTENIFLKADKLAKGKSKAAHLALGIYYIRVVPETKKDQQNAIIEAGKTHFNYLINNIEKEESYAVPTYYFQKGRLSQVGSKHGDAISDFKIAIDLGEKSSPKDESLADYYFYRGLSYYALGERTDAQKDLSKAITLLEESNPGDERLAAYYYELGRSFNDPMNIDEAEKFFKKAISIRWKVIVPAYVDLGTWYLKHGKVKKAQKQFEQAISLTEHYSSDMLKFKIGLGNALAAQKEYQKAIQVYNEAAEINPNDALVELYLADAYIENKDPQNAMLHMKKAEQLAESDKNLQGEDKKEDKKFFNDGVERVKGKTEKYLINREDVVPN